MAKVMHLMDPRVMEQMSMGMAPVNPTHRSIATLDQDMQTILSKTALTDDEKVREYNQVLQRYLEYHDHVRSPPPPAVQSTSSKDIQEEIIHTVPPKMKRKADAILERIRRHPNSSWNDMG